MTRELRDQLQEVLGAAYTITTELGGGGMSRVFLAREIALDRDVVIKVLPPELAGELSAERFRREIQLAARLQHPHIVPVLAAGSAAVKGDRAVLYYTMPFIDGETLRAKLQRTGELPVSDVLRIARALADSLSYAHESGVVHRDLKPENILLTRGHALVADFGVAKAVNASVLKTVRDESVITSVGLALGTPAYMAPEQAAADPAIDHRADIYALGCVLYELLTGSSPFAGRPTQAILAAHMAETPDPLSRRRPATPPGLSALVMRMLEKRPADRPQTADEVLAALESLGTSTSAADIATAAGATTAGAATNTSQASPSSTRSRTMWRIGIVGGLLAGLAIVAVLVTNVAGKRQPSLDPSAPPAVAIVDQTAASETEMKAVSASMAEFLTDALSGGEGARLISDAAAARFLISTAASPVGSDSALLRVRLIDQQSGQVLRAFTPDRVSLADPGSGADRLRGSVRAAVGMVTHPMLGPAALPGGDAPALEAFAEFRTALVTVERLLSGITADQSIALAHMERAAALDSSFVQPRIWRSFLMRSGLTGRPIADSVLLKLSAESSEKFTPYERSLVALFKSSFTGDVGSAVRSSEMLYAATPVEWTAQAHARSLMSIARYKSAITLLDSLAPTAGADDPQFWSDYTRALHMTGEHEKELEIARRAVALMPERRGVRAFVTWALIALDSGEAAVRVMNEAVTMPAEQDATTGSVVSGLSNFIAELRAHGQLKLVPGLEARLRNEIADAATGGKPPFALQLQIASALLNLGDDSAARAIAIELRRTDSLRFEISGIIGIASARLGDTATAEREMQRLAELGNRFRPYSLGFDWLARARIAAALGRETQAISLAARSIAEGNGYNVRRTAHTAREFQALKRNRDFQKLLDARGE